MNRFFLLIIVIIFPCLPMLAQNGIINSYYSNRNLRASISYVDGVLDGTSYWFYENGNLKEEKTFSSGKLNGIVRYYYQNGLVKEDISVKNGIRHGQYKSYYENGALKEIREYEMGRLVRKNELSYDANYNPPLEAYLGNRQDEIRRRRDDFICEVEVCPKPAGGKEEIQNNLVYPEYAKLYGLEGRVKVLTTVDERGNVTNIEVIRELGLGCEQAAVDAIMNTKFLPGFDKGKPVKSQVAFDVEFKLSDADRNAAIKTPPPANIAEQSTQIVEPSAPGELVNTKPVEPEPTQGKVKQPVYKNFDCEIDKCPVPVGGLQSILDNLILPQRVKRLQIEGDVIIEADVDQFGLVLDTKVLSGIGYGADDAVEVAILNTEFTPGMEEGEEVRTKVTIIVPIITKQD